MTSACAFNGESAEVGRYVRSLREGVGFSQRDLAQRLGCQQPAIARLETGGVKVGLSTLQRIVEALGYQLEIHATRRDLALNEGVQTTVKRPGRSTGQGRVESVRTVGLSPDDPGWAAFVAAERRYLISRIPDGQVPVDDVQCVQLDDLNDPVPEGQWHYRFTLSHSTD
jgi:transcriptional regulator with XRE-family HTH domain